MPELPEVEVICQGLRPHLIGRIVTAVHGTGKPMRHLVPLATMEKMLGGGRVKAVITLKSNFQEKHGSSMKNTYYLL